MLYLKCGAKCAGLINAQGGKQILPYVEGTTNVKKQPIIKHLKSDLHKDSEGRAKVQDKIQANELTEIPKGLEKMDKKTQLKMEFF